MSTHSLAEAKEHLEELIARAERGEEVVITRDGKPVVAISKPSPLLAKPHQVTPADIEWLDKHRVGTAMPDEDAGALVSRLRDEWDERLLGR